LPATPSAGSADTKDIDNFHRGVYLAFVKWIWGGCIWPARVAIVCDIGIVAVLEVGYRVFAARLSLTAENSDTAEKRAIVLA
jgi:hypothetical protein